MGEMDAAAKAAADAMALQNETWAANASAAHEAAVKKNEAAAASLTQANTDKLNAMKKLKDVQGTLTENL
jgi:hypothetical protein